MTASHSTPSDPWRTAMSYVVGRKRAEEALGFLAEVSRSLADPRSAEEVSQRVCVLTTSFLADRCTIAGPDAPGALLEEATLMVPLRDGSAFLLWRAKPFSGGEVALAEEVGRRIDAALTIVRLRPAERIVKPRGLTDSGRNRLRISMSDGRLESNVRTYSRIFPAVFDRASGARIEAEDGRQWIDFFCGAGALNYGHNPPGMMRAIVDYIERNGVLHSLDMATKAKRRFLEHFAAVILGPRGLDYKVQFCGPTGANAVEAALKLARRNTRRTEVIAFERAYHGMSLGALAVTWHARARGGAGVPLRDATFVPFDDPSLDVDQALAPVAAALERTAAAAVIVETVQAEGGVHVARDEWLRGLRRLTSAHGAVLIVDDIQAGCGRTGPFFSFERAGIEPDLVCLSKSISGCGLPMSLLLIRPELDVWLPGEHNGTFRGQNLAFVAATEALRAWEEPELPAQVERAASRLTAHLRQLAPRFEVRGRGLLLGLDAGSPERASAICAAAFEGGLLVESVMGGVVKLAPPLVIDDATLDEGAAILGAAIQATGGER